MLRVNLSILENTWNVTNFICCVFRLLSNINSQYEYNTSKVLIIKYDTL